MDKAVEEYKLLISIYYKELNLFYSKITIFTTIQLGLFAGVIAGYNFLISSKQLFSVGIFFMILISCIQTLIAIRGNAVNEALIITLADFENKNNFTLLSDFNNNINKIKRIRKMNFPSYAIIILCITFILAWLTILLIIWLPSIKEMLSSINQSSHTELFKIIFICVLSMLYAVTMKISDLLDEHGLVLFKGAPYFFSFICGIFGGLLIFSDTVIANIILAMVIGFVIRKRIDYNNHILSFVIITSCFFIFSNVIVNIYFPFLIVIILLGFLKDTKYKTNSPKFIKLINKIYLYVPIIYALPSLIYSIMSSNWTIFFAFFVYDLSYNITRLISKHIMNKKQSS